MFVAQEPVVAASCLLAGVEMSMNICIAAYDCLSSLSIPKHGFIFLPAVVRPILNPLETTTNQFPPPVIPGKKKME
ncbi:hypothetical protein MKX01_021551 [Papaver californicum]|nr:hypothetical protein MKX01_021551 [Papaver californicum]